jgi:hypothetical protein
MYHQVEASYLEAGNTWGNRGLALSAQAILKEYTECLYGIAFLCRGELDGHSTGLGLGILLL